MSEPTATMIAVKDIKMNPNNPRVINDDKFKKLVKSIQDFPEMLHLRPIVVNSDMIVLGGNMRLKACKEAGLKQVPCIVADNLTDEKQREFIIKDNVGYGEWDWKMLSMEWDEGELVEWGIELDEIQKGIDLEDFFDEEPQEKVDGTFKIVLEYTQEEYYKVVEAFDNFSGSKEDVVYKLLISGK